MDYKTHRLVGASVGVGLSAFYLSQNTSHETGIAVFAGTIITLAVMELRHFVWKNFKKHKALSVGVLIVGLVSLLLGGFLSLYRLKAIDFNLWLGSIIFIRATYVGSLIPDIDKSNSKLGRTIKPISSFIEATAGHRFLFHSPEFYVIFCLLIRVFLLDGLKRVMVLDQAIWNLIDLVFYGIATGVFAHLFADAFNSKGIPVYLYSLLVGKLSRLKIIGFKMGGIKEVCFRIVVVVLTMTYCVVKLKIIA